MKIIDNVQKISARKEMAYSKLVHSANNIPSVQKATCVKKVFSVIGCNL